MSKATIDDQVAHSGKCSLKITGMNNRGIILSGIYLTRNYVEKAGYSFIGKYRVTAWIKTYGMETVDAELKIHYYRKNKEGKDTWFGGKNIGKIQGTTDWTKVSEIVTIPSDCDRIEVCMATAEPNAGIAWFDDISLIKIEEELL